MEIANLNKEFKQGDQKAGFTLVADQWNYNFDTFQTGSVGPSSAQPRVEFFFFFLRFCYRMENREIADAADSGHTEITDANDFHSHSDSAPLPLNSPEWKHTQTFM